MTCEIPNEGAALRHLRRLAGVTQAEIALALGVSQSTISRIESGELVPSPDLVFEIATAISRIRRIDAA